MPIDMLGNIKCQPFHERIGFNSMACVTVLPPIIESSNSNNIDSVFEKKNYEDYLTPQERLELISLVSDSAKPFNEIYSFVSELKNKRSI